MVASFTLSFLSGCSADNPVRSAPSAVFLDASSLIGQRVTVTGYIRFEFENRALYPADNRRLEFTRAECLPVLVRRDNEAMMRRVSGFNGKVVTIRGVIDSLVEPGMINLGTCKDSGIVVEQINAA
jgi:hypothetical protein